MNKSTTQSLRKINQEKIIKALRDYGESNKNQLSEYTSLSVGTCYNILMDLLETKEVVRGNDFVSTGGRKAKSYKLNEDFSYILAISIHREFDSIYYILRVYNHIDNQVYEHTSQKGVISFENLCEDIDKIIGQFPNIYVISLAIPAVISKEGEVETISLVKGLEKMSHIHIKERLEVMFQKKVIVDNDVNVATIGYYSSHTNIQNIAFIYQPLDELAGISFIVDGHLLRGEHGLIGEVPYLPILNQKQQYQYLKKENGLYELLVQFIVLIMIMNDPQQIVICCQRKIDISKVYNGMLQYISDKHFFPEIVIYSDIYEFIFNGLLLMGREMLNTNLVMKTQGVYK